MIDKNLDKAIINSFYTKGSNPIINRNKIRTIDFETKEYLLQRYNDSDSLSETINRIYYNIEKRPVCPICGGKLKYLTKNRFSIHCSCKCSAIDKETRNKCKETCLKKYGVVNGGCSKEALDKIKKTNISRRGVDCSFKDPEVREKIKKTNISRRGVDCSFKDPEVRKKSKETCLQKYGVEYSAQATQTKNKIFETKLSRYSNGRYVNPNKAKDTSLKRYGAESWTQTQDGKVRLRKQYFQSNIKRETTCLEKYGVKHILQNPEIRKTMTEKMKENGTIGNISKQEKTIFELLKNLYPDVVSQYTSKVYPYNCDFYIPSLDLYIEYNGTWTHGSHPFDVNSDKDLSIIKLWKSKNMKYYNNAINTWSVRDVDKRETAKRNNLNYVEWFSYNEAIDYINKLQINEDNRTEI